MTGREMAHILARALFNLHSVVWVADKYREEDYPVEMEAADRALKAWEAWERAEGARDDLMETQT